MSRKILLPREIDNRLNDLTRVVEEVNGILLYRRREDICPIESVFMTGVGTEGHVQSQPERIEITNEFFKRNPDYRFIKVHTHSQATIDKFGQYYARNFSSQDHEGIKEQLKHDKDFMAMLITPKTKLLYGTDNPELHIVDDFPGYANRSSGVDDSIKVIAQNLGYDISRLPGKRR